MPLVQLSARCSATRTGQELEQHFGAEGRGCLGLGLRWLRRLRLRLLRGLRLHRRPGFRDVTAWGCDWRSLRAAKPAVALGEQRRPRGCAVGQAVGDHDVHEVREERFLRELGHAVVHPRVQNLTIKFPNSSAFRRAH